MCNVRILRNESQVALDYLTPIIKKELGVDDPTGEDILNFLEDHPLMDSTFSEDKGDYELYIDTYKVGSKCIRAMIPYSKGEGIERILKVKGLDLNSLQEVYPVRVMVTRYRTLEEMNGKI